MPTAHDFPALYQRVGVDLNALGCVMLELRPLPIEVALGEQLSKELFFHPDPRKWWVAGPVGQRVAHVTLLYGLMSSMFEAAEHYFGAIDEVMAGWERPSTVAIRNFQVWTPPDNGPYRILVGEVHLTPALLDAHERLSLIPHVDTHLEYKPHVTLAYVKPDAAEEALTALQWELGTVIPTVRLNYGRH